MFIYMTKHAGYWATLCSHVITFHFINTLVSHTEFVSLNRVSYISTYSARYADVDLTGTIQVDWNLYVIYIEINKIK